MSYHSGISGNEKRAFAQKLAKHDAVEMRRQVASAASSTVSFSTTRDARTIAGVTASPGASTCCGDVTEPADFEEFLEAHQLELASDELRDLLDAPPDDIDVGIVQRRYRTVRPLAPDKHEIGSLDLHVQECVRHYLSDWVYALRRYAEFGSAGVHQRALEAAVPTGGELHQEYEVDGVVEFSIPNGGGGGANKTPSSSARSSWLMADTPRGSWASSHFDLKNSAADALLPSLLDRVPADTLDRLNQARRQQARQCSLFALYPPQEEEDVIERRAIPPLPSEHRGHRILVKCLQLKLEVAIEPIFASMALYDAGRKKKISENFYFDMNSDQMKSMLRAHVPYVDFSTLSKSCIFDITYPSSDIFLVIKLEKVLQGDISECTELYLKDDKSREKAEKAHAQAAVFCERLGQYRMPFAWTAIYLMNILDGISSLEREAGDKDTASGSAGQTNSLERKSSQSSFDQFRRSRPGAGEGGSGGSSGSGSSSGLGRRGSLERRSFSERRAVSAAQLGQNLQTFRPVTLTVSTFFRQESDRLKEEDLFKHLQDLKRPSSAMKKLKCIGGTLKLDISPCPEEVKHCLTPELAKLRPYPAALEEFDEPHDKSRPCKEMLEFPSQDVYEPHYLYRNILYVSPKTVNFVNYPNKPGISARNITVRVQFLNGEGKEAALPVIFGRSSMPEFVTEAYTAISYHTKNPDFYDEIKIKLPANLTDAHHLLFTFFHVSCQQRKAEPTSVATPIGYTWLPVFREGRLNTTEACLPVLLEPPPSNYPYITPDINLPGVKWVDNHRPLFTVSVTAETSVHAQDKNIDSFLCMCRIVESGVVPPRIGENNVEMELNRSIQQLSDSQPERLVRLLPLLLDRLLLLMVRPPMVAGQVINTGQPCFHAIGQLVKLVTDLLESRNDQHGRNSLLMTYVRYQCGLPQGSADHTTSAGAGVSPTQHYPGRASSLPRQRAFSRSTSNPNMAAHLDADSEVGQILGRALDRTASLRTVLEELQEGVSQELLVSRGAATSRKVVHEELALQWVVASGKSRELALANPWFFFELMFKSMLCSLASSGRLEAPRRYRFPDRYCDDISTLVETVTKDIVIGQARESREVPRHLLSPAKERPATAGPGTPRRLRSPKRSTTLPPRQPRRARPGSPDSVRSLPPLQPTPPLSPPPPSSPRPCRSSDVSRLNAGLAFFINDLLSVMDRSFVLGLVRLYCREMANRRAASADAHATQLTHLKLDFLRIVCSHEHYFSLNLPFGTPLSGTQPASSPTPSVGSASSQSSYLSTLVANERPRFAELSGEFRQQHYLAGLVLGELEAVLPRSNPGTHSRAVSVVRSLLAWHDADPRFQEPAARARVALLYLPLVPIVLDNLDQVYDWSAQGRSSGGMLTRDDGPPASPPAVNGGRDSDSGPEAQLDSMTSTLVPDSAIYARLAGIRPETSRDLLLCALWVLKNTRTDVLRATWAEYKPARIQQLLRLLHSAVSCFEYKGQGRRQSPLSASQPSLRGSTRAVEAKSRLEDIILGAGSARSELMRRRSQHQHSSPAPAAPSPAPVTPAGAGTATPDRLRWRKEQTAAQWRLDAERTGGPRGEMMETFDPAAERCLSAEASMVALDALETVIQVLSSQDGLHGLLGMAFRVLLHALSCNQSTAVIANMFATQRSLVTKYPALLFDEETEHCADLCLRLLEHCSSAVSNTRSQASASLYLLMRQNFEIGNNFARVKMQVTMSLSSLVGTSQNFNEGYLRRSLKTILEYAENDQELAETTFPGQVSDLVFNLHMILSDTVKMKEFQEDHEMLLDLMYRIAKGYQNSPDLRLTWLDNMAKKHMERAQYAEAGMCYVHSAALVSEYLSMLEPKSYLPLGAAAFENMSPNVLEESAVSDDVVSPDEEGICTGKSFTEPGLVTLLEQAVHAFDSAAMHEAVNDVYKMLVPIHENARDYRKLGNIHGKLQDSFNKVISADGKRMFWSYFRVGFYGFKFGDLNGEEFLYKEPALTKLAEISNRLESFYSDRFGASNVHTIKGSNKVDPAKLDPETAYIQITYVEPYFDMWERRTRITPFERNFNVKTFMFATPYTLDGRAHGELHEQYKRKTILTVANSFPYVKTRVPIVSRREVVLTPIEVAIEDIRKKTAELSAAIHQDPPDTKILQMVLQGCIGTTVNQGPMEVANVFLSELFLGQELTDLQNKLKICFRDFSKKCMDALKKNRSLIKHDQHEYQKELEKNYQHFTEKLRPMFSGRQAHTLTLSKSRSRELMPAPHLKTSPFV